jgi:hypothetical protein
MLPTSTFSIWRYGEIYYFTIVLTLLPFAAQSQNNKAELEQRMYDLYGFASQLKADLPVRDYRGNYFNLTLGTSPFGHIETWRTENVCDCAGNVVDTKDVSGNKAPISFGIGWETRLSRLFSMRFMGNYAHLTHGKGRTVVAETGNFTTLQQDYNLSQLGINSAVLLYFNQFYGGMGISYTSFKASGFQTTEKAGDLTPPQYSKLKADILSPKQTIFAGNMFVGFQKMLSPKAMASLEIGISRKFYANIQLNFPLSSKIHNSFTTWKAAYRLYEKTRREAVAIDVYLHPAKFQVVDYSDNIGTSSNSCPR